MKVTADRTTLNDLLGVPNRQFRIPPYQRAYAWQAEHIDELWDDVIQNLNGGHFMGSLVLNSEHAGMLEVIDGQQRLTTLLILLGLVRDSYAQLRPDAVGRVQRFMEDPWAPPDARFKFRTGEANWGIFRDCVLRAPGDGSRRSPTELASLDRAARHRNHALLEAIGRLNNLVGNRLAGCAQDSEKVTQLEQLEKAVVTGLEFVVIQVPQIADAFVIFETLNDRGLALSAGDLLKNHLLATAAQAGDSVEQLAEEWDEFISSLNGADVTRFLRHFLLISHPRVRKDDVFSLFKKDVERLGARALMAVLATMGRLYGQFVDPNRLDSQPVRAVLENLVTLRAIMCYTGLLAARRWLVPDDEFVAYARLAEILTFRYSSVCSKDAKELERCYHRSAKELSDSEGTRLAEARRILIEAMPGSDEFKAAFSRQAMGQRYLVNYVLRCFEEYLDPDEKTTRASGPVHIEHIMPQTLSHEWEVILGERVRDHAAYVNRWGNLALLGGKRNISASNDIFARKCRFYQTSNIHLTRQLAGLDKWDLESIDTRQKELAELADQVWSIPVA